MIDRIFIARGASDVDDLERLGLEVARRYFVADSAILIDERGRARPVKGLHDVSHVDFLDIDSGICALIGCMEQVKREFELAFPDDSHLGHASAAFWLFYWMDDRQRLMVDIAREGDCEALRAGARSYIQSGFGARPIGIIDEHGHGGTAD